MPLSDYNLNYMYTPYSPAELSSNGLAGYGVSSNSSYNNPNFAFAYNDGGNSNLTLGNLVTNTTPVTNNNGNTFLGLTGSTWQGIGAGLQGLSGLASAYMGLQNYNLAKQQFNFQKNLANRNLANQARVINNTYDNAAQVAAGMIGGTDANGRYGTTSQATVDRYAQRARNQHVDGSAI